MNPAALIDHSADIINTIFINGIGKENAGNQKPNPPDHVLVLLKRDLPGRGNAQDKGPGGRDQGSLSAVYSKVTEVQDSQFYHG